MNCEWILDLEINGRRWEIPKFHAPTPEEAGEIARDLVSLRAGAYRNVTSIKAELFRGGMELDMSEFLTPESEITRVNPSLIDRHVNP